MAERDHPVYCPQCGSIAYPGDSFCGVCGSTIPPDAPDAVPTEEVPTQVQAPPDVATRRSNLPLLIGLGVAIALALVLGIGTVAALTLLRGEPENQGGAAPPPATTQQEDAAGGQQETEETNSEPPEDERTSAGDSTEDSSQEREKVPTVDEDSGPTPGYNLIQTPDGSLSVEVPPSWGVETGEDSEKQGGPGSWSYHAGEYLSSSITTADSLDAWYGGNASGAYMVASRALAQYTDDELTHSLLNANKANNCTAGPYEDYDRPPYSGKIQTWYDCGVDGATTYTAAAAPEGRECVVVLGARIASEADRKAIQHIFDTFKVDCGRVTSEALASPSASVSSSASAFASAEVQTGGCSDPAYQAQNPGECGTIGYNPISDPGDNYSQGVVVGDDTPDCARPEDVLESGLCRR